jgi:hypothetical protein
VAEFMTVLRRSFMTLMRRSIPLLTLLPTI